MIAKTVLLRDAAWYIRAIIPPLQWMRLAPFLRQFRQDDLVVAIRAAGFTVRDAFVQPGTVPRLFQILEKPV